MGSEKQKTLEELKLLDQRVDQAAELEQLRPMYHRADEIAGQYTDDIEVQVAAGDVKQHIMQRGTLLNAREGRPAASRPPAFAPQPAPTAPVGPPAGEADLQATLIYPLKPAWSVARETAPPPAVPAPMPPDAPPVSVLAPPPLPGERRERRRTGTLIGAIAVFAVIAIAAIVASRRIATPPGGVVPGVTLQITTAPRGASVRVNGELKCTSDCALSLPPGNYQIAMELDGYQPAAESVTLAAGQPSSLNLTLEPQPATVRIATDLRRGAVVLDDRPAANLQRGSYTFENVEPGRHTVKVTGPEGEASFSFDVAQAKIPGIMGTVAARNVEAVLVASFANRARVVTSSGPWKLEVNGRQQRDDAGPAGVDLSSFDPGPEELVIQQGADRRDMKESFGPAPTLTAFVRADPKGTLIVSTGEDGARVFLNDREYPRRTQQGELRIPMLGSVAVRVMKDGFMSPLAQTADVKKGAMVRMEFKLAPSR